MSSLLVSEIFKSIQGESTQAGLPCVFVRLARCNLRCAYCDTVYAQKGGTAMTLPAVLKAVERFHLKRVEITGGEPMLQEESLPLMRQLLKKGYTVLLETNGSVDLKQVPKAVVKIMDIKTPASKMERFNCYQNFHWVDKKDEVKFVICSREDYLFAKRVIHKFALLKRCHVLFSPAAGKSGARKLAEWILGDNLDVRLNLQLHKIIWPAARRGV